MRIGQKIRLAAKTFVTDDRFWETNHVIHDVHGGLLAWRRMTSVSFSDKHINFQVMKLEPSGRYDVLNEGILE